MSRRETLFSSLFFLGLIVLPGLGGLLGLGSGSTEKRAAQPWPSFAMSTSFFDQLGAAITDRLAMRGVAIELDARLDLYLFRDSPRPAKVWQGEGDWLFLSGFWRAPCTQSELSAQEVVRILGRISRLVETSGRRFRFVIAPDKLSIEGQRLASRHADMPPCGPAKREAVEAALRGGAVPGAVDLWTPLRQLQGQQEIYYHGDIHWRPLGAMILVRELLESLDTDLWRPEAIGRGMPSGRQAGTLAYLGIPAFEAAEGVTVRRPETRLHELVEEQWSDGTWAKREPRLRREGERLAAGTIERLGTPRISWRTTGGERVEDRVAMIHDSFAWDALPMLTEYLAQARLLTWQQGITELGGQDLVWAETIVVESVEYVIYSRLAQLYGVTLRGLYPDQGRALEIELRSVGSGRRERPAWLMRSLAATQGQTLVLEVDTDLPARLRLATWVGKAALSKEDIWLESGPPQLIAIDLEAGVDRAMIRSGREGVEVLRAWLYPTPP